MMGGIMANVASTTAGVLGAHAIMGAVSSLTSSGEKEKDAPAASVAAAAAPRSGSMMSPCQSQMQSFMRCLESNNQDISMCQWASDALSSCKKSAAASSSDDLY